MWRGGAHTVATLLVFSAEAATSARVVSPVAGGRAPSHLRLMALRGGASTMETRPWFRGISGSNYDGFYCHQARLDAGRQHMRTSTRQSINEATWSDLRASLDAAKKDGTVSPERLEAATKVVGNHLVVAADMTNVHSLTQSHLGRLPPETIGAIDALLVEVARRLIGLPALEIPSDDGTLEIWRRACAYLDERLQVAAQSAPGRAPDLSPPAGAALRAVLMSVVKDTCFATDHSGHHQARAP